MGIDDVIRSVVSFLQFDVYCSFWLLNVCLFVYFSFSLQVNHQLVYFSEVSSSQLKNLVKESLHLRETKKNLIGILSTVHQSHVPRLATS